MTENTPVNKTRPTVIGYTEYVGEQGGSWFGINSDRHNSEYPRPFFHGDYIALYQDDTRKELFLEGRLYIDEQRLMNDATYTDSEKFRYVTSPFYFQIINFNEKAIQDYLQHRPRSGLRYEIGTDEKILSPQTICTLFAEERAAILISNRVEKSSKPAPDTLTP